MTEWLVVVNAHAGSRETKTSAITRGLEARGIHAEVTVTRTIDELEVAVERAVRQGINRFVAVGGDGSAHHLINVVLNQKPQEVPVLGIVAEGSGCDFVRTFGQDTSLDASLDRLMEPDLYRIDLGHVTYDGGSSYVLNALNSGVAAASVRSAERLPRWIGGLRYTTAFWVALAGFRSAPVDVGIKPHRFSGDAINIVVANGQFFGGGLNIAPRATLVDDQFDIQVFSGPRRMAFTVMPRLAFGAHLTHKAVRRYVGSTVDIEAPSDWPLEADGELLGAGSARVTSVSGAIDFVL